MKKPNDFYDDPIDQWLDRNPILAAVGAGFVIYVFLVIVFSL